MNTPTIEDVLSEQKIFDESVKEFPFEENTKTWTCSNNTIVDYSRSAFQQGARFAKAAMQEWTSLQAHSNEKYGFVKASERLPEKDGQIVIKNPIEGHYALGYFSLEEESKESLFDEGDEWLDESTPIPIQTPCVELEKEVERLKGLIFEMHKDIATALDVPYTEEDKKMFTDKHNL